MRKITFLMVALFATMFMSLNAQTPMVKWSFTSCPGGTGNYGASPFAPESSDVNLTVGGLTRYWTPTTSGSGAGSAWGGNNFTATSFAAAVTANEFITFALTANTDYTLSVTSIGAYNIRRSGTGPSTGQWQYALGAGTFTDIDAPITWGSTTTAAGNPQTAIDLSGISALQNVAAGTTVTFRLVVWGASGTGGTFYFNDGTGSGTPGLPIFGTVTGGSAPTEPTVGAPIPIRLQSDVVSVYSDTYTAVSLPNYEDWGQVTVVSHVQIGGNTTMKLTNFNYQGWTFAGAGGAFDISAMDSLHVDVWTADETLFKIGIADPTVSCTPLTIGTWNSFDIPISALAGTNNLAAIAVMKFEGSGGKTVYIDNVYFFKEATPVGQVTMPVIAPAGGNVIAPVTVTITSATEDAVIYYTTDGNAPTTASTLYTGSFTVSQTATVRAIATKAGMTNSNEAAPVTYTFIVLSDPLLIDDFEGANKGWATVACYQDIRPNEHQEGLNTSAKVLFTNRGTGNDAWSGAILAAAGLPISPITGYQYLHAKMYRNNTNNPSLKVTDATVPMTGLPMAGITIVANQWQDVVFDLGTTPVEFVMFMVDGTVPLPAEAWMLVDDIILSNDPTPRVAPVEPDDEIIYQTGFESSEGFTASTTYNNATMAFTGASGSQWGTIYGTPSTTNPIADGQSMQMRWYTSATTTFGSTETRFDLQNVTRVKFKAKNTVAANGMDVTALYSTDGGTSWVGSEVFTLGTTPSQFTYNISETGEFATVRIKFLVTQSGAAPTGTVQVHIDEVVVYGIHDDTERVETPVISPAGSAVNNPVEVSIACATQGATIYYTTNGNVPTASDNEYTAPFTITATTTVKAIAFKEGLTESLVATEIYTFTVFVEVADISEFLETGGTENLKITDAVTAVYQNGQNLYVQDESGYLLIFGNIGKTFANGDKITGLVGKYGLYGGSPQMTNPIAPDGVSGTPVLPTVLGWENITTADHARFVKIEKVQFNSDFTFGTTNATHKSDTLANGNIVRNNFNLTTGVSVLASKIYDITGFVSYFDGTLNLYFIEIAEHIEQGLPTIQDNAIAMFVSNGALNVISEGGMIEIFTVLGVKVANVNANIGITTINDLPVNQLLIVKIGNKNGKVVVR